MRYNSRVELERIGRAGSYFEYTDEGIKARVLSSFWMHLDPEDDGFVPHQTTAGEGFWEAWITLWVSQNVSVGSKCIDIGANIGYYTMFLLDHGCEVLAIEPQPRIARLIVLSAIENGFDSRLRRYSVAVAGEAGEMKLTVPKSHGMNASLQQYGYGTETDDVIDVNVITLNDIDGQWDFVKVDIEGAEDTLFDGAEYFMGRNPNCVYLVEWGWARLPNPYEAAERLFEIMDVNFVTEEGGEAPVFSPEHLKEVSKGDWIMLVCRSKR